jgi:hypothetical protein
VELVCGFSFACAGRHASTIAVGTGGLLFLAPLLMIVFRQKYPRWWFDWNLELLRFTNRVGVYLALMDDRYPSTDEEQSVHLGVRYPDVRQGLNRWLPLVKWFLAIPHYVVLAILPLEMLKQSGLTAAWLASNQDQAPLSATRVLDVLRQAGQGGLALHQLHERHSAPTAGDFAGKLPHRVKAWLV